MTPYPVPRSFTGNHLDRIAFPVGGLGAGMFAFGGTGAFSHFSIRHLPDYFIEMMAFSAVAVHRDGRVQARLLEGPVPTWKPLFPWNSEWGSSGHGGGHKGFGLPRFDICSFSSRFPFGTVVLEEDGFPLKVTATAWSP